MDTVWRESRNTNITIRETIQELKNEMARLWEDNVRLTMEHEKILKSLSDKKNQRQPTTSPEQGQMLEEQGYHMEHEGTGGEE